MDYGKTLNLPNTAFPMRANLVEKEPQILERWKRIDIHRYILRTRENRPTFVLHDGPPYANGAIHMGTAMNKILKDIVIRYKTLRDFEPLTCRAGTRTACPSSIASRACSRKRSRR